MGDIVLAGATSGTTTLTPTAVSGTTTLTLPATTGTVLASGTAVTVAQGGTGNATATAYAVQCGGTTSTGAYQSIASVGTAAQVLTSNGAGALPTFQSLGGVTSLNGQTGAITNTDYGVIGSYVIAVENDFTANQERLPDVTVAGSTLYRSTAAVGTVAQSANMGPSAQVSSSTNTSLSLSGTWRRMTRNMNTTVGTNSGVNLYVRVS